MSSDGSTHGLSNEPLWAAIKRTSLPSQERPTGWLTASRTVSFQERLSSRYELTPESAQRLEKEYRRFLYLKAIDGGILTPSKRVDQAWHLHIETRGEWIWFCNEVLKRRLDHQTGLSQVEAKANYARLLDLYRREFNDEPPSDIWAGERERRQIAIGIGMACAGFVLFVFGIFFGVFLEPFVGDFAPMVVSAVGAFLFTLGVLVSRGNDLETIAPCG